MVTFIVLNSGAALVAMLVALTALGRAGISRVLLAALCAYLVVIHSIVLLSGLTGHLTAAGVGALLAAAIAGALWLARSVSREHERRPSGGQRLGAASLYPLLATTLAGALWTWPHLSAATRLWVWDDYAYHMIYPALWLRAHAIGAVTPDHAFTMQAWYPLSASVVAAWFMLPFHGSRAEEIAWVSLTGPLYAGLVAGGTAALAARLGCRRGAWALAVVLFATSHRIDIMASSFSDADLAVAAALFGAFVFAVPRADTESRRDVIVDACYAGSLTGLALGIKISAAVPALIILVMVAARAATPSAARADRLRTAARIGLIFALSWGATAGYWYVRNLVHTGNPLYPATFLHWPGTTFPETSLLEYSRHYGFRRTVADALRVYMNWPLFHAMMAVAGLIGLAGWVSWRRSRLTRAQAYFGFGALTMASAVVLVLPATPFSAGNAMTFRSGFIHWDSMRYIALLPLLGWAALAYLIDAGAGGWKAVLAVVITCASLQTSTNPLLGSPVLLLALAVTAVMVSRIRWRWPGWTPGTARRDGLMATAVALLFWGAVLWRHDAKAAATGEAFYRERFFGAAAAVLDRQPPGTRVAVFGDQWVFLTFGARDHLVPVRLDHDGRVATVPIANAMTQGDLATDPATFLANLRAAGVRVVVVLHLPHPGRAPQWPTQQAALEASPAARLLYRGEAVAVWAIDN
jgi:hypothetical protein